MKPSLSEITAFFHREIPITGAMGIEVVGYDAAGLVVEAPLEPNHNHLQTAFGGSLNALATLTGYGLVWLELGDCHVVIKRSSVEFRRPVTGRLRAVCRTPAGAALSSFHKAFESKGRARLTLQVTIEEHGVAAVDFEGEFVALK